MICIPCFALDVRQHTLEKHGQTLERNAVLPEMTFIRGKRRPDRTLECLPDFPSLILGKPVGYFQPPFHFEVQYRMRLICGFRCA